MTHKRFWLFITILAIPSLMWARLLYQRVGENGKPSHVIHSPVVRRKKSRQVAKRRTRTRRPRSQNERVIEQRIQINAQKPEPKNDEESIKQSPINIALEDVHSTNLTDIYFQYRQASELTYVGTKYLVLKTDTTLNAITIDSREYQLQQIQFRTPSEHFINDVQYPAEMQLIHQSMSGDIAIVSILLNGGHQDNERYFSLLHAIQARKSDVPINLKSLLPRSKRFFRYEGSLTYSPFTQGVKWFIMTSIVNLSDEQITSIQQAVGSKTNRSIQDDNNSDVFMDSTKDF